MLWIWISGEEGRRGGGRGVGRWVCGLGIMVCKISLKVWDGKSR